MNMRVHRYIGFVLVSHSGRQLALIDVFEKHVENNNMHFEVVCLIPWYYGLINA